MGIEELKKRTTCSTLFLVYGLGLDQKKLRTFGFINAYLSDPAYTELEAECPVYLLFKVKNKVEFNDLVDELKLGNYGLVADYDYEDDFSVLLFEFPEKFREDYKKFLKGEYSKFSKEYKAIFPEETTDKSGVTKKSFYFNVFTKQKELKDHWYNQIGIELDDDQEYWSSPYVDTVEVLDIEKVRDTAKI